MGYEEAPPLPSQSPAFSPSAVLVHCSISPPRKAVCIHHKRLGISHEHVESLCAGRSSDAAAFADRPLALRHLRNNVRASRVQNVVFWVASTLFVTVEKHTAHCKI